MNEGPILRIENDSTDNGRSQESVAVEDHAEAVAFVEKHRDFLEHYAKGKVKIEPAPEDLSTFAFDLEKNIIYVNSMFYKKQGFSDEKTLFAVCHEIEHFLEKKAMLSEEGGERRFREYLQRLKKSKAFSFIDNRVSDIRENRSVIGRTNRGMSELETLIYTEDLYPETDFTSEPRHIQFAYAIVREARVPGEKCKVHPDVRTALDEVAKVPGLMEVMTDPQTPMSTRQRLQDKYIWPKVEALMEKDMEDKKKQKQKEKEQGNENGDKSDTGEEGKPQEGEGQEDEKEKDKKSKPGKGKSQKGKDKKPSKDSDQAREKEKADTAESGEGKEESDPNIIFAKDYDKAEGKFPKAVPIEEIEKAFKEWQEKQKEKGSPDKADEDYAKKLGVEKKDLQNYRKIVENIQKIINLDTGVEVMKELQDLFLRIISKRLKITHAPKYPTEDGDELIDPAQLVADVKSGNLEPKVWQDTEIREKRGDKFGEVEITLVCDRSGSMEEGQKAEEQRRSAVMVMEVLKEFAEMCRTEKINMDKPLEVRSEVYSFAAEAGDKVPMKKMSTELGETERIEVLKKLYNLPGSTTDFSCLEAIAERLDEEAKNKIKIGELKKIVIVFTDGGSDNPAKVQAALKSLRDEGVVVIGIGITSAGSLVLSTYAPNAMVVEDVARLPIVLGELLKDYLKNL